MKRVAVLLTYLLGLSILCEIGLGSEISGVVRAVQQSMTYSDPLTVAPPPSATITMCSEDRIYRTASDREGRFVFKKVLPGTYEVVAAPRSFAPESVANIEVRDNQPIQTIKAIAHGGVRKSACYVSTEGNNLLADYDVDYGSVESVSKPEIYGTVKCLVHHRGEARGLALKIKPAANARVRLIRSNEKGTVWTYDTNSRGRFTFTPNSGIYLLEVSYPKYHKIITDPFLVPRQNVTKIEIVIAPEGDIVIQQ